jgi:crotonobetainyl-CoA:carnitine CoA-transferase CaiB-like acyl-CoA transferase
VPLTGIKVLELGHLIAGPFASTLLGYFGAGVIKIEPPGGDPIRGWRGVDDDGTSLWWRSVGRNKRSAVIDLASGRGGELALRLIAAADVVVENFRPGTLERWGIDLDAVAAAHPELIVCRVSGYGQTGPYADRPGYASVCEAFGGLRHLTGEPGAPTVRTNLSLGDSLAGLHAALGIVMALFHRERGGAGQAIDVAIYESVFAMLESTYPEYRHLGAVRGPSGSTISGVAPTGSYPCAGGEVVLGANSERLFAALCQVIGKPAWIDDPAYAGNAARVERAAEIDAAIEAWTSSRPAAEAERALRAAGIPCSVICDVAQIAADPHYQAREMFEEAGADGQTWHLPALAPKLSATPGATRAAGPAVGEHSDEILGELGLAAAEIAALRDAGVIQ